MFRAGVNVLGDGQPNTVTKATTQRKSIEA